MRTGNGNGSHLKSRSARNIRDLSSLAYEPRPFTWIAESSDSVLIVRLEGELDIAVSQDCEAGLSEPLMGPESIVVADLKKLTFADSSGLRVLIGMRQKVEARGGRLLLSQLTSPLRRVIDASGLTERFEYMEGEAPQEHCPMCGRDLWWAAEKCPSCGETF